MHFRARSGPTRPAAPSPANLVSSLERGEVGLDGRELPHVAWIRVWRRAWKIVAFVSLTFFLTCGWFAFVHGTKLAREQTRDAVRNALDADLGKGPCVRVDANRQTMSRPGWTGGSGRRATAGTRGGVAGGVGGIAGGVGRAIALRGGQTMVAPRIVSTSTETTRTVETLDDPACVGKKIRRERHAALSVSFVPLDDWPWGRRKIVSVAYDAAVCVQHYLDVLDERLGCDADANG